MSYKTQPAQDYIKITSFNSSQQVDARAVKPVGGTQFVFVTVGGIIRTVLAADYDNFTTYPTEVKEIDSATDCDEVHVWS